jgi:hypothetical protein
MRNHLTLLFLIWGAAAAATRALTGVRAELEKAYQENTAVFMRWDVAAVMALRAPDFHTVTPNGAMQDRRRWSCMSPES